MVFGNSLGSMWALVQRAIGKAGLEIHPRGVSLLSKGQRSVKGLASGFENVATLDLVLTLRPSTTIAEPIQPSVEAIETAVDQALSTTPELTPSHVYLELLAYGIKVNWDLGGIDLESAASAIREAGYAIDRSSGQMELTLNP